MKLAKYNEIVVAVAGTLFVLGLLAIGAFSLILARGPRTQPGVVIDRPASAKPVEQNLVFCPALTDTVGAFQYIPVAVVVASDADQQPGLGSAEVMMSYAAGRNFDDCVVRRYGGSSRTFNVVVRDTASGAQRLLFDRPAQIDSFELPCSKCAEGEAKTPSDVILWKIRSTDTNKDGVIDGKDALVAYISGLDARELVALTPPDATLLDAQWMSKSGTWQFQIRRDANKDGKFTEEDGSELVETDTHGKSPAKPFLDEAIRERLNAAIR